MPRAIKNIDLGDGCHGSINSEGLPNNGIDYYISDDLNNAVVSIQENHILYLYLGKILMKMSKCLNEHVMLMASRPLS